MNFGIMIITLLISAGGPPQWQELGWLELMGLPDSVLSINNVSQLEKYLDSQSERDRFNACQRLGQIGGEGAYKRLRLLFENEPWQNSSYDNTGIRYYALSSIGQTKFPDAVTYLRKVFDSYAYHYRGATGKMTPDTAAVAFGAIMGLCHALAPGAYQSLLGAIYVGPKYNCEIKIYAYKSILGTGFEKGNLSREQIIDYLRWQLKKQGPLTGMLNDDGTVNAAYVERVAVIELLDIYQNGGPIQY